MRSSVPSRCPLRRALTGAIAALLGGCAAEGREVDGGTGQDRPEVVVTFSVLGAVVRDLVGDQGRVRVLMPDGMDPHDWEPSAKSVEALHHADLVVANGLGLEETLEGALAEVSAAGTPVFLAGDHVSVRAIGGGVVEDEDGDDGDGDPDDVDGNHGSGEHEHGDGAPDPHLWMDPRSMRSVVEALGPVLEAVGVPVGTRLGQVEEDLGALDEEVAAVVAAVPADRRDIVTGHESLGYFADRYGLTIAGTVVSSVSSQAEASAGALARLKRAIEDAGVGVIFTETGSSGDVVEAVADEVGVRVVPLATHDLPEDGTYRTFMVDLAVAITTALAGAPEP